MNFSHRYRQTENLWITEEAGSFGYSDGDDIENFLLKALQQCNDLSIGSPELTAWIKDWPSLYHLSPKRADLLRPVSGLLHQKSILEIGSGCGALTRYLGELNAEVLALEGSLRRARITRERCRDLENVHVIVDNFDNFEINEKFDCVTLIGVFEYSNLFIKGDNPPLQMLQKVKQFLKPNGFIIIAIENKLGLKYLAGAPEDHLAVAFSGIENRYNKETAITFGKQELEHLLQQSGFHNSEFLYPFPDYKLPVAIITDKGSKTTGFDVPSLLLEKHEYIQEHPYNSAFNNSLAQRSVHANGLMSHLSNSFLVVAGPGVSIDASLLATSYSSSRKKALCKSVEFRTDNSRSIAVIKKLLHVGAIFTPSLSLILEQEEYIPGPLLQEQALQIVSVKNWNLDQLKGWAKKYYDILEKISFPREGKRFLDGKYLDLTPFNIIISENNEPFIFDQEWVADRPVDLDYVFFRGVNFGLGQIVFFSMPTADVPTDILELSILLVQAVTGIGSVPVNEYREKEKGFFSAVWLQQYEPFSPATMRIRR